MALARLRCASALVAPRCWSSSLICRDALVGMEACPSAHHWSRELQALGHCVRLMPPSYVKAYLKRSKNDANDAAAICEAVVRPSIRFVPIKTEEQQAGLMLHRTRQLLVRQRTMLSNGLRGYLAELGAKGRNGISQLLGRMACLAAKCRSDCADKCPLWGNSRQRRILPCDGLSANAPKCT